MFKAILTSIVVPGIALLIAMPTPTFAESHPRAGSRDRRHSAQRPTHYERHDRHHQRDRHRVHHSRHDRHRVHHSRHDRHHRRRGPHGHHGARVGITIGGYGHRPLYPHGHVHHIHDAYCPVVIRPVVIAPAWEVYYHSHYRPSASAILHIVIGPFNGALYIDDQYYGEAHRLNDGGLELPVSPGLHTVQLRSGSRTYSQKVHAKPGATAVVKANNM